MPDPVLKQLQQRAALALQSSNPLETGTHKSTLFSEETSRLKRAYAKLQERFLRVNRELALAEKELHKKIEEIKEAKEHLNDVLKGVCQGILFVDLKGTVVTLNPAAVSILQCDAKNILSKPFWESFPDLFFGFSMREALCLGLSHKLIYQPLHIENQSLEIEISTTYLSRGEKNNHGILVLFQNITQGLRAQCITHRNERLQKLGELITSIAHEIRNPLGGIRGYALLLYRDLSTQETLQEMVQRILEGTKNLERFVSDILQYARPIQISFQSLELGSFLKQVAQFVRVDPAFPPKVEIEIHIPQHPIFIPIDSQALRSALLNFIYNALHAMPYGGKLTIALLKGEQNCQIELADTGIGMNEELLSHLFSPFFTTKTKGNGIGLSEAQKIIHAHGGTIDVRSQPTRGTSFTITLPIRRTFE